MEQQWHAALVARALLSAKMRQAGGVACDLGYRRCSLVQPASQPVAQPAGRTIFGRDRARVCVAAIHTQISKRSKSPHSNRPRSTSFRNFRATSFSSRSKHSGHQSSRLQQSHQSSPRILDQSHFSASSAATARASIFSPFFGFFFLFIARQRRRHGPVCHMSQLHGCDFSAPN